MSINRRQKSKPVYFLLFITIIVIFYSGRSVISETNPMEIPSVSPSPSVVPASQSFLPLSVGLYSPNVIVMRRDNPDYLLEKGSEKRIYPASLTKIMTAIVAIENLDTLEERLLLSRELFDELYEENASMAGFLPEEEVPALDLLYGLMLPSGGECCMGLAEYIAGSEDAFVELMNQKAEELGMEDTHFTNTTGLHDEEHYTTVRDLAVLLEYSLENDTFRDIFTSKRHSTAPTNLHPDGITMYSTMFKNLPQEQLVKGKLLGGKTGYTSKAGLCLASLAQIGNVEYIMVSAGAEGNHTTKPYHITDALTVYNQIAKLQ